MDFKLMKMMMMMMMMMMIDDDDDDDDSVPTLSFLSKAFECSSTESYGLC